VIPGTAAASAGLREGDRIWGINDQRVETANELIFQLGQIAPGEAVEVHFDRAHSVPLTLGRREKAKVEETTTVETPGGTTTETTTTEVEQSGENPPPANP